MTMRTADALLMIAARDPVPGETKTRLGTAIGMERAATLYEAFLRDIAMRFNPDPPRTDWDVAWTYSPPGCDFQNVIASVTGRSTPQGTHFVAQEGSNWGMRQANLLRWGFRHGYERVVLMASDSPQLPLGFVEQAFSELSQRDVALGRVRDGGYYLIGVSGDFDLLSTVRMSTASAADGVMEAASRLGLTVGEVPSTFDVDEERDLEHLRALLAQEPDACPHTAAVLPGLGLT